MVFCCCLKQKSLARKGKQWRFGEKLVADTRNGPSKLVRETLNGLSIQVKTKMNASEEVSLKLWKVYFIKKKWPWFSRKFFLKIFLIKFIEK